MYETPVLQASESIPLNVPNFTHSETLVADSSSMVNLPLEAASAPLSAEIIAETSSSVSSQTIEVVTTPPNYDSWINKPIDDYTATEGLLLILVVCTIGLLIAKLFKL